MSAPTDRLDVERDLELEAARWARVARAAQQSDAPPTLVPEPPYGGAPPWSPGTMDGSREDDPAIRRVRARQAHGPVIVPAPIVRLRHRSVIAAPAGLMIVVAIAAVSVLVALGRFPSLETWNAWLTDDGDNAYVLTAVSTRPVQPTPLSAGRETSASATDVLTQGADHEGERASRETVGAVPRPLDPEDLASLRQRGKDLFGTGDIAAARLMLQRAAEALDPEAALALAATYDPLALLQLKVYGIAGDAAVAREWYKRARHYGSPEATRRLELLATAP
jgi:TPR repeat protein